MSDMADGSSSDVKYDEDLWGAFSIIERRDASGTTTLSEMVSQLDKYASLVEDFGTKCKALWTKPSKCDEGGSVQEAWTSFRSGMEREALECHNRASSYRSDVVSPLRELVAQRKAQKARLTNSTKNLNTEKKKASADLGSAKKKYMKKTEDHENSILAVARGEAAALPVNKITKLRSKAEKLQKDSTNLFSAYESCLAEFHTFQEQYEEGIRKNLLEWQEAEFARLNQIKSRVEKFHSVHTANYEAITSSFDALRSAVDSIDVEMDVSKWVASNKTAARPDAKAALEKYEPKTDEYRNHLGVGASKESAASSPSASVSSPGESGGAAGGGASSAAAGGGDEPLVRATYDFAGTGDEDELLFQVGDVIHVLSMLDENWWTGTLKGSEGMFPSNHVTPVRGTVDDLRKKLDSAPSSAAIVSPATDGASASASPAAAGDDGDAAAGDESAAADDDDGGAPKKAAGDAPAEAEDPPPAAGDDRPNEDAAQDSSASAAATAAETAEGESPQGAGLKVRAKYKFEASSDDEVTILPGDVITIIEKVEEWYIGVNTRTNEEGMFPANWVEIISDS